MYNEYFGLKETPFNVTPDPKFIFFSRKHMDAFSALVYGIESRKGFIQITEDFGIPVKAQNKKDCFDALNRYLLEQFNRGYNSFLIIDEAQDLTLKALEQIRLLSNLETNTDKFLQIVLVGQPELRDTLNQPSLAQLRQRVHVRFHLTALDRQEVEEYILHRLHVAGMDERANFIFTKEAIDLIYDQSRGIPRMINKLCDWAMLGAFSKKLLTIDDKVVENVAVEAEGVMC